MRRSAYILTVICLKAKELFLKRNIVWHTAVAVAGIFIALRYHEECYRGMEKGVTLCLEVLIPSLFFFMVVAAYMVQSGIAEILCRPLSGLTRVLFRLPGESAAVILLAMIGGYPVGASCTAILADEGRLSPSQAAKTAYIAVAAGPGFLISYVGAALLGSTQAGYALLVSQAVAVILTGVIVGHTVKSEPLACSAPKKVIGGNLLVSAVKNASRSAFGMCAMVVVFCALSEVVDTLILQQEICDIASVITEITNGCNRICSKSPLYVIAFYVGFGGLSVHFQIFALLSKVPLKKGLFFLYRIIEGIIAMTAAYIYLMVIPVTTEVFRSTESVPSAARSATLAGSAALVISSLLFIGSISKKVTHTAIVPRSNNQTIPQSADINVR